MNLESVFSTTLTVSIMASVLVVGLSTTPAEGFSLLRRPGLLLRSFLSIYILVPAVTVVTVGLLPVPLNLKVGLVLLAISSASVTNWGKLSAIPGSEAYEYSLHFLMSLLAIVTVPASLAILTALPLAVDAAASPMAVAQVVAMTVFAPLVVGMLFRYFWPGAAGRIAKPLGKLGGIGILIALLGITVLNFSGLRELGPLSYLVIAGLCIVSLAIGHILGGPEPGDRVALAVASASRYAGVAALIAQLNFHASKAAVIIAAYYLTINIAMIPYMKWAAKGSAAPSAAGEAQPPDAAGDKV